ncbi:MAG: hypothetical protein JRN68_02535 [Nitrososphaerota archaeon]|nr:hypothetical protein [Nitrososphaerota archaeon]
MHSEQLSKQLPVGAIYRVSTASAKRLAAYFEHQCPTDRAFQKFIVT